MSKSHIFVVHNTSFPLRETFKVAQEKPSVFCGTHGHGPFNICPSLIFLLFIILRFLCGKETFKVAQEKPSVFCGTPWPRPVQHMSKSHIFVVHNTSFPLRETFKVAQEKPSVFCGAPWPRPVQHMSKSHIFVEHHPQQ